MRKGLLAVMIVCGAATGFSVGALAAHDHDDSKEYFASKYRHGNTHDPRRHHDARHHNQSHWGKHHHHGVHLEGSH